MKNTVLTHEEARQRLVTPADMVSCSVAFIDCKLPGSHLKQNYSFIGPGVTQSSEQVINIPLPHGFNIGAAAMPKGSPITCTFTSPPRYSLSMKEAGVFAGGKR